MEQFLNLRCLIGTLSPRRQEIITLKFFGGLRNREIALMLALDERTVASHLCRGLEDLHRKLANEVVQPNKENVHEKERPVGSARS
jgi:DNA-directed RNA polymerase specialized sigma24 family protein